MLVVDKNIRLLKTFKFLGKVIFENKNQVFTVTLWSTCVTLAALIDGAMSVHALFVYTDDRRAVDVYDKPKKCVLV